MPTDEERRWSHVEAQRRYRERIRARREAAEVLVALEKRHESDAKNNEQRRRMKFAKKYGYDAFAEFYFPKYEQLGKRFLPRSQFDEGPAAKKKKTPRGSRHISGYAQITLAIQTSLSDLFPSRLFPSPPMPCELPFFPNAVNYVDDNEHDKNTRKLWYLVLDTGLFTKRADTDGLCAPDDIAIFYTRAKAQRKWDSNCCKRHTHRDEPSSTSSDRVTARPSPSPPPSRAATGRRLPATNATTKTSAAPKRAPPSKNGAARSTPVKREAGSTPIKREASAPAKAQRDAKRYTSAPVKVKVERKLPLYLDGTDDEELPDIELPQDESPPRGGLSSRAQRSGGRSAVSPVSAPSLMSLSPTVSSASSVSLSTVSISMATTAESSASRPPRRRVPRDAAATLSANPLARLLYNSAKRTLYKDAEKAVHEMGLKDSVQVVDCADIVSFCAGHSGTMAG
ncbi:hypothetical protein DFH09DRAFT_1301323 [Mycena vulgaris]|nr:hypothetical protein DFH09DRAFT_1301323 [Mycena vulgaris]